MAKLPLPTELLDTDSMLPAYESSDHAAVLLIYEHMVELLRTLWYDSLPTKRLISIKRDGKIAKKDAAELLEGFGPLSTSSALVKVCYLHGQICANLYEGFEILRAIRNRFAHTRIPLTLADPKIESMLDKLALRWAQNVGKDKKLHTTIQTDHDGIEGASYKMSWGRAVLFIATGAMIVHLRSRHFEGRGQTQSPDKPEHPTAGSALR